MSTATIVVSLPALKPLIMKVTPHNTTASGGYIRESLQQRHRTIGSARPAPENRKMCDDDEVELVHQDSCKSSLGPATRTVSDIERQEGGDDVKSIGHITVLGKRI
jgi:hypothetical protein